jgi:signal peptidase I
MENNDAGKINFNELAYSSQPKKENSVWEIVKFALLALIIVIPIRTFIAQPFIVSGSSMVPTFENGEYLIVDEISYRLNEPRRGDVIVFRYPKDTSKFFIKRIIGLPNDTVIINGQTITIKNSEHPEGITLSEPYVKNHSTNEISSTLGEDEYYVMGDNRSASSDSRIWGTVPKKNIIGRAFLRVFPIGKADVMPGEYTENR